MQISEAFKLIDSNNGYWARPLSWVGSGKAYAKYKGALCEAPIANGQPKWGLGALSIGEVCEDWVVELPDKVLSEIQRKA